MENWISAPGVQTRNPFSHTAYVKVTQCKLRQRNTEIQAKAPEKVVGNIFGKLRLTYRYYGDLGISPTRH